MIPARIEKLLLFVNKNKTQTGTVAANTGTIVFILLVAYLLASTITAFSISFLTQMALDRPKPAEEGEWAAHPSIANVVNYNSLRKTIVDRNIFNSEGKVPDEPEGTEGTGGQFNENDVCHKVTLPIALVGTIYLGPNGESLATVRETGYDEADVYHIGDKIIGNEQAVIHDIQHQLVVINNNGVKECLEATPLKGINMEVTAAGGASTPVATIGAGNGGAAVTLDHPYVEEALGPGFSKILEMGRLVPEIKDNVQKGFKLIGVKNDSLWRKVGLGSGDVITSVNGISMAQPDQGFALYNALQDQREIRVDYLKNGNEPVTITIEIK